MQEFSTSNAFFPAQETSFKDCPLAEQCKESSGEICVEDLDKPMAKETASVEKYSDVAAGEFRVLTDAERTQLKDKLGWTDAQLDKCTINDEGTVQYKTDRHDLEGKQGANGVEYERKNVVINGVTVEGVFPVFDSVFDVQLPDNLLKSSNGAQFGECNKQLKAAVEADPELRKKFTPDQLDEIADGDTPTGYTWHHNEEPGRMQLVKTADHDRTQGGAAHTGGKSLWGDKYGEFAARQAADNGGAD